MTDYKTDDSNPRDTIPGFRTEITNRSDTILPLSQSVIHHPIHWYNPWEFRYNLNRLWWSICSRFAHLASATSRLTRRQTKRLLRELYNTLVNTPQAILMLAIYAVFQLLRIAVYLGRHLNVQPLIDTDRITLKPVTVSAHPDPAPPNDAAIDRYCKLQRILDHRYAHELTEDYHRIVRTGNGSVCACTLKGFIAPDQTRTAPFGSPFLKLSYHPGSEGSLFRVEYDHLVSRPEGLLRFLVIDWKQRFTEIRDMFYGLMGWGSMMSFNYWLLWASIRIADLAEEAAKSVPLSAQLLAINETHPFPSWVAGLGIRTHVD